MAEKGSFFPLLGRCCERQVLTGLPIDSETLSNFCYKCTVGPNETDPNYAEWFKKHKENCQKNYDGPVNSMEMECSKGFGEGTLRNIQ